MRVCLNDYNRTGRERIKGFVIIGTKANDKSGKRGKGGRRDGKDDNQRILHNTCRNNEGERKGEKSNCLRYERERASGSESHFVVC